MNQHNTFGLAVGLLLATSCINNDVVLFETELVASVGYLQAFDQPATLHIEVHHAEFGGPVPHALGLIASFEVEGETRAPDSWRETILVPTEEGEGLVVYAWLDLDNDGVLCGLNGAGNEPVGLIKLAEFPSHNLEFELLLDGVCLGPERLYP